MTHNTKEEWKDEFDKEFVSDLSGEDVDDQYWNVIQNDYKIKQFIRKVITSQRHQERIATVKECLEKVDEYFDGLISIPLPQLTKESLKDSLNNLIGD